MDIRVVSESDQDLDAVRSILNMFLAEIGQTLLDDAAWSRVLVAISQKRILFFVARDREVDPPAIVGICSLSVCFSTFQAAPLGIMDDVFVRESSRGRGIAGKLIRFMIESARAMGCCSIMLGCDEKEMGLYHHLGFKRLGTMMAIDLSSSK